ncbi:MAG: alpha/beta fold hydrolase BchO [Pseudomonadota bacterium]
MAFDGWATPQLRMRSLGKGPVALLVHGTASTSHSWLALAERLKHHFTLLIPDLPGHGASAVPEPGRYSPLAMATALHHALEAIDEQPELVVGHSAGCAVLARGLAAGTLSARGFIALNPALLPLPGLQQFVLPGLARVLAGAPMIAEVVALQGRDRVAVKGLLQGIGSKLDGESVDAYRRLFADPAHVRSVLRMMAEWNLPDVAACLPSVQLPTYLIGGGRDRAVPAHQLERLVRRFPDAERVLLTQVGHLAQEEQPDTVARLVLDWCERRLSFDTAC